MKLRATSAGLHFFDRKSGLNVLMDELHAPLHRHAKAPRSMSIALLNACDLKCPYCYAPKHRSRLPATKVLAWAGELDAAGSLQLGFGGGEPTLYPGFPELCAAISSQTDLAVTFTTHGHRFSRDLSKSLSGQVHFIRVSIDGVGATYERLRGRPFSHLLLSLELIADTSAFGVNVVVNQETVDELDEIGDLATRYGASEILLLPQRATRAVDRVSDATTAKMNQWIASNWQRLPLAISSDSAGAINAPTLSPFPNETELDAYAHMDADGILRRTSSATRGVSTRKYASLVDALAELAAMEATPV
jgi:sulfatase maturation enzyme AslB (radical SAM superfamily)